MSDSDPFTAALFGFGGGIYLFYQGFKELRLERMITGMATSKVRSVAMGTVELFGRAGPQSPIADPVYGKPCCYYNVQVQEKVGSGKDERWETVFQAASDSSPFYLIDDTGSVLVYPEGAELYLDFDIDRTRQGLMRLFTTEASGDPVEKFVATLSCASTSTLRIQARILRQDEPVYVLGYATPGEDAPDGSRGPIVVRQNLNGPFVLSDKTEGKLVSELTGWAAVKIVAGPLLTIACAAYLAHRLGVF